MNRDDCIQFWYREFYDLPRSIVAEYQGQLYLLESLFDDNYDEYSPTFQVYVLPPETKSALQGVSWEKLSTLGSYVGEIPAEHVHLDDSRRRALHVDTFEHLIYRKSV